MPKDTPQVIYIATLTTPEETSGWKSGKSRSSGTFFSFLVQKKRFSRMVLRDTLGRPVRFYPKNTKEVSHFKPEKKCRKWKKVQEKFLFSPKCSSGSFDCWFQNPDEILGRDSRIFYADFLFCISCENKAPSDCFSGQVDCSLGHFFWILDKKRSSINSHVFKKLQNFQKKTTHHKPYLWPPKTIFQITGEANRQDWEEFPLQLRKNFWNGRFLQKSNA